GGNARVEIKWRLIRTRPRRGRWPTQSLKVEVRLNTFFGAGDRTPGRRESHLEATGLGQSLLILCLRNGIRHDAGAGVEVDLLSRTNGRANQQAQLTFAVKSQVTQTTRIGPARDGLKFINDVHGSDLRGPGDAPARETMGQRAQVRGIRPQATFHR